MILINRSTLPCICRMSSEKQNPKSPAQQRERIVNIIKDRQLPWWVVATYEDAAISGKYARKRPGFTKMMNDIEQGTINIGAILVDSIERFGRTDDLDSRRKRLANRHNVVILSADRHFSDPYTPESQAMSGHRKPPCARHKQNFGQMMSIRGKIGSINDGYWPGSPDPLRLSIGVGSFRKT